MKQLTVLSPFYGWGNWGLERLNNLPRVTQLVNVHPGFERKLFGLRFSELNCEHHYAASQVSVQNISVKWMKKENWANEILFNILKYFLYS